MRRGNLFVDRWTEGARPEGNLDAVATTSSRDAALLVVADGASDTLFAEQWANALVTAATQIEPGAVDLPSLDRAVAATAMDFRARVGEGPSGTFQQRKWRQLGSQATLLVVQVRAAGERRATVETFAVGDSVMILVGKRGVEAFPIADPTAFGRRPQLVASSTSGTVPFATWSGMIEHGDVVLAVSDGVAAPLLRRLGVEGTAAAWRFIAALLDAAPGGARRAVVEFAGSVGADGARTLGDDATVAICAFLPAPTRDGLGAARRLVRTRLREQPAWMSLLKHMAAIVRRLLRRLARRRGPR